MMTRRLIQLFSLIPLLILGQFSLAADRDEMIDYFIVLEKVEERADKIIEGLKHELIRSDKNITDSNFDRDFGEMFEDYREAYILANKNAYGVYSDEQITELYDFYKSPFGEWYRQEEKAFGPRVDKYMAEPGQVLRAGIQSQRQKGKKRKRR